MPRPRKVIDGVATETTQPVKRINNGPVDVPNPPSVHVATGVDTPAVSTSVFGPGAHYPRFNYSVRLFDPVNGSVVVMSAADMQLEQFRIEVDKAIEHGMLACNAPDAPRVLGKPLNNDEEDEEEEEDDELFEDKRIGRAQRRTARRSRSDDTDPVLTFGKYNGQSISEVYNSGKRGVAYVEWLAENARDRKIRRAAETFLD